MLAIGEEGKEHVDFLKTFARGAYSLISSNHTLPLLDLIDIDGITVGVFPKVAFSCSDLYHSWAKSSVGDILNAIAQCLEVRIVAEHLCFREATHFPPTGSRFFASLRSCPSGKQLHCEPVSFPNRLGARTLRRTTLSFSGYPSHSASNTMRQPPDLECT